MAILAIKTLANFSAALKLFEALKIITIEKIQNITALPPAIIKWIIPSRNSLSMARVKKKLINVPPRKVKTIPSRTALVLFDLYSHLKQINSTTRCSTFVISLKLLITDTT